MRQIFFLLFFVISGSSATLQSHYTFAGSELNASLIDPEIADDFTIYTFEENRNRKSFSAESLIKLFDEHNLNLSDKSRGIVHFERGSSVSLEPIINDIKAYYLNYYPQMQIKSIHLHSNTPVVQLPEEYSLSFKPNAYKYNRSSLIMNSKELNTRLFFHYTLEATVKVFKASHNINRGTILNYIDLKYTSVPFKRLTGTPLRGIDTNRVRLKKRIPKGKTLYEHDVELLPSVLKNKTVYARFSNGNVHLEFQATSLQDGRLGDVILIQKKDNTRLKAKVVGTNQVEIE